LSFYIELSRDRSFSKVVTILFDRQLYLFSKLINVLLQSTQASWHTIRNNQITS
jgi:hypothetical protein